MGTRLYVGNLSDQVTVEDLEKWFSQHGQVDSAEVFTDLTGGNGGFGFVEMRTSDAAKRAIAGLHGRVCSDCKLAVTEDHSEEETVGPAPGGFGDRGGFGGGDYNREFQ